MVAWMLSMTTSFHLRRSFRRFLSHHTQAVMRGNNLPIHRVVTCFILTQRQHKIALFHRCESMPTFANHWAGISGTIEANESPRQAAQRELLEETNLTQLVSEDGGLYVNVPHVSKRGVTNQEECIMIRIYPFVVMVPDDVPLKLRGTEHDRYQFVTLRELEAMESQCVPGLVQTFHHSTFGRLDMSIPERVREWANDQENGASVMTRNAIQLLQKDMENDAQTRLLAQKISMLRPSMVPIVNVMREIIENGKDAVTMEAFQQQEVQRCVDLGIQTLEALMYSKNKKQITIATISNSGTLAQILQPFANNCRILCGQSTTAGSNEGELMANDLNFEWVPDAELQRLLSSSTNIDLLLVGSDYILPDTMVNKVGTRPLCLAAKEGKVPVYCCADRWKVWEDAFGPPMERDMFELVPLELITKVLMPPPTTAT
jgi:translation initiation factor 2B subunit (eIF-2B alpha/beta/delta family)/8-oxo-dGTP pyrophosphatase MutT (NUDIX family)